MDNNALTASVSVDAPILASDRKRIRRCIFHLAKHVGYGNGNVHVAVDLACVQAAAGHDVTFVSGGGTFVELLVSHGVKHVTITQDQKRPLASLTSLWRLIALARAGRPDIIHAHMMGSAVVGYVASRISGAVLVTTVHNSFDKHAFLMRLGDQVVAVSDAERDRLAARSYRRDRLSAVMNAPNNSPRERFVKQDRPPILPHPCIVTVGGLHRRKGIADVIDAFELVSKDAPEWHLVIAGEGPDRSSLEEQAGRLNLRERVTFLGYVQDPKPVLQQSDIFVLASHADPCSLAIGEARAAGCAIVATSVGGTPQMLEYGKAGRLVPPGEPKRLAEQLLALMCNPEERRALSAAAAHGAEVFDVRRVAEDYQAVYDEAIARRNGGRRLGVDASAPGGNHRESRASSGGTCSPQRRLAAWSVGRD